MGRFDRRQGRGQVVAKIVDVEVLPRTGPHGLAHQGHVGLAHRQHRDGHEVMGRTDRRQALALRTVAIDQHDVRTRGRQAVLQPVVADRVLGLAGQAFAEQDPPRFVDPLDFAASHDSSHATIPLVR